jgi:hypothetical protein
MGLAKKSGVQTILVLGLAELMENTSRKATTPRKVLLILSRLFSQGAQPLIMLVHQLLQVAELTLSVLPHRHAYAERWSQHVMA